MTGSLLRKKKRKKTYGQQIVGSSGTAIESTDDLVIRKRIMNDPRPFF